jgi:PIN domain nuclease of toxin-antitoxin system
LTVRLLLDTHIVLALLDPQQAKREPWSTASLFVSVASIWELAIKVRQGKLSLHADLAELEARLTSLGCSVLPVGARQAVAEVEPWPATKDPFDRLLLAVCSVEGLRLVTRDRLLVDHPLAWRPASA